MQVVTPQNEIHQKLLDLGWTLSKVDFKSGTYRGKAKNKTTGQEIERAGDSPEMVVASLYQFASRAHQVRRRASLEKVGSWKSDWLDQKQEIAQAYSKMPAFEEKAVEAWKALAAESKVQADAIRQQITVEVVDDPEPYQSAEEMAEDVHKNKHLKVSRANSTHPIWSQDDTVNYRIVHDVIGHCQSGGDFSWRGENQACATHLPLVSPLAREALFTESLGNAAYRSHFQGLGPQKIGFLSQFLHPVQEKEGEHIWAPHGGLPQMGQAPEQATQLQGVFNGPGDWVQTAPSQVMKMPPSPVFGLGDPLTQGYRDPSKKSKNVSPEREHDPNLFWSPTHSVPPLDDPAQDYINIGETVANAAKVDTNWQDEEEPTQKQAIMNAFRAALLSPRKHIKWNAAHYQALMHADPATKSVDLWHMLEEERERHNQSLGYPEGSHLAYREQLEFLAHELQTDMPQLSNADAMKEAKTIIFRKTKEFEEQLGEDPTLSDTSELKRYNMARKLVTQWLRDYYTPARGWSQGQMSLASADSFHEQVQAEAADWDAMCVAAAQSLPEEEWPNWVRNRIDRMFGVGVKPIDWTPYPPGTYQPKTGAQLFETDADWQPIDSTGFANSDAKYGAFMGAHLDAIEEVGAHIDAIRKAALDDIDKGGKGHHFRNAVMNMNLKGVNPKVASFAWLLLAPLSSELGIIDSHIARGLRRDPNNVTPKDYYKLERMQRAAKDSSGYGHMPLGMYHWGLWDAIRSPGEHSDHSPLRVLDPLPWDSPDAHWDPALNARQGPWVGPLAFENARGYMENAALDYDQEMSGQPEGQVPVVRHPNETL